MDSSLVFDYLLISGCTVPPEKIGWSACPGRKTSMYTIKTKRAALHATLLSGSVEVMDMLLAWSDLGPSLRDNEGDSALACAVAIATIIYLNPGQV